MLTDYQTFVNFLAFTLRLWRSPPSKSSMGNSVGGLKNLNLETLKKPRTRITNERISSKEKQEPAQDKKDEKDTSNPVAQKFSPDEEDIDNTTEPFFPEEIILEILSWLPPKSLLRFKCVCKKWCSLIENRQFIKKHISQASTLGNMYNTRKITPDTPNALPKRETFQFICGCDGLLVMKNNVSGRYHITNPTIRQKLDLPSPHKGRLSMILTFISATGYYKLVSIYYDKEKRDNECCEILTVGIDDSWRSLKLPNLLDEDKKIEKISVVSAGEAVHCVRVIKVGSSTFGEEVVSLDMNTESFTTTSITKDMFSNWGSVWAIDWNGHLAFADMAEDNLIVLVLEDFKKHKWGEMKRILSLAFTEAKENVKDLVPLYSQCGNLWFWLKDRKLICYNIESRKINQIISPSEGYNILGTLHCYPPSLVSLKGMKPEQ